MGDARPLFKVDRNVDWQARCEKLEERLAACRKERDGLERKVAAVERVVAATRAAAAELAKAQATIADLEQRVEAAEANSRRFHALLLAERIRKLPARRDA